MTEKASLGARSDLHTANKYWAFISYSHSNEPWGNWLHKALEQYRVPRPLVGRKSPKGDVPERIFPVFKDREELPSSSSLNQEITEALEQSRYLVVVCSPEAAVSKWVNEEVRIFKAMGREDRVLCFIVDGEPNVSDTSDNQLSECFPESVRFLIGPDGQLTKERADPLAADVREGKDGKVNAKLKLLAGILGVDFDELKQRDKQRRFWRRVRLSIIAVSTMSIATGIWYRQWTATEEQRQIALARSLVVQSQAVFEDEPVLGLRLALEGWALIRTVKDGDERTVILSSLRDLANRGRLSSLGSDVEQIYARPNGSILIVDYANSSGELRSRADGSRIGILPGQVRAVEFSPDPDATYFVVYYSDAPDELRRSVDGSLIVKFPNRVEKVYFDSNATNFGVDYVNTPGQLRRSADGSLIATFESEIYGIVFSPDPGAAIFGVDYGDRPDEVRRTTDASLIATVPGWYIVKFSPDPNATYFVVAYPNAPPELRRTADGSLVMTPPRKATLHFNADGTRLWVGYLNGPGELRRAADGSILSLPGKVASLQFSPDTNSAYFIAYYSDAPPELRRSADNSLIATLPRGTRRAYFSTDPDVTTFVVDSPALNEARRTADGSRLAQLKPGNIYFGGVIFSPDPQATIFLVRYVNAADALHRTADGALLATLPGFPTNLSPNVRSLYFSTDTNASYFVINYAPATGPSELRRTSDASLIQVLSDEADSLSFSPDSAASYLMVHYKFSPTELRRSADGSRVPLSGELESAYFNPNPSATTFVVDYREKQGEIRYIANGSVAFRLAGQVSKVAFSPAPGAAYFIVDYEDRRSELWQADGMPRRLAQLDPGRSGHRFDLQRGRLTVWYPDGRAYLLALDWLAAMGGDAAALSPEDLVRLACDGPLAASKFSEVSLEPYLEGREPQACPRQGRI